MSRTYRKSKNDSWKSKPYGIKAFANRYEDNDTSYSSIINKKKTRREHKLSIYDY